MSNDKRSVVIVPSSEARHVKAKKNGKDWYVQRAGIQDEDGLAEPFELWHSKQEHALKAGQYFIEGNTGYVNDGRLVVRPKFVPVSPQK